jgi:hypothetical protein
MAEYLSCSIKDLINDINRGKIVLPAMQRSFVWPEQKIYDLFDSLMRDFPIGTCLFWEIHNDTLEKFAFNQFIKVVDEQKLKMQRGDSAKEGLSDYIAVLDGQQRITSLYVGISGHWRTHVKGRKYEDESSYFNRYLCINLMSIPQTEEEKYPLAFVPENEIGDVIEDENGVKKYWLKISDVFDDNFEYGEFLPDLNAEKLFLPPKQLSQTMKMIRRLDDALKTRQNVNYYPSKNRSLPEVIDIFVRVNSGGQKLAASDLMLSVASGTQGDTDIHIKMKEAIDEINSAPRKVETAFKIDKELVLTAGLLFTGAQSLSLQKPENYAREKMDEIFLDNWSNIINALSNAVRCIEYIGFDGKKLSSKSMILPIAYYYYKNNLTDTHISSESNRARCDRIFIRQWMLRSLVNDVFMDGTGSTLTRIRRVLDNTTHKYFPLDDLMVEKIKKPLFVGKAQVDDICDLNYGDVKVLPILMEVANYALLGEYEVDHIWPKDLMNKKSAIKKRIAGVDDKTMDFYTGNYNKLSNLQLLRIQENRSKSNEPFGDWITRNPHDSSYFDCNCIPTDVGYEYHNFIAFYNARKKIIAKKIQSAFPDDFNILVERYGLSVK